MNSKENTTRLAGEASVLLKLVDQRDGLLAKAQAARNLSSILTDQLEWHFDERRGVADESVIRLNHSKHSIETTTWVMSELYSAARDASDIVDELLDGLENLVERLK